VSADRLVLLRHGRTAYNHAGIWQGQADVPLDDVGRLQVKAAAEYLLAQRPVAVVASDLARARDTGQAVADAAGVPLALDRRLREIDVGVWEDRTDADIAASGDDEALAAYRRGEDVVAGGAERLSDVGRRGAEALSEHRVGGRRDARRGRSRGGPAMRGAQAARRPARAVEHARRPAQRRLGRDRPRSSRLADARLGADGS